MNKYKITWTVEDWYEMEIEADSEEEALDKFYINGYNSDSIYKYDSQLQDSVEVEEI